MSFLYGRWVVGWLAGRRGVWVSSGRMRPERHLTTNAQLADFAVDLSNVVRDRRLGGDRPADLARFTGLIEGLIAFTNDEFVRVYAVADWSLLRSRRIGLTDEEQSTLRSWRKRGWIEVFDKADPRVLELADATGMRVICHDKYLDAYRVYPWIAGNRDRFFLPALGPNGVTVRPRIMPDPPEWKLSRKEEQERLRPVGLYDSEEGGIRIDLLSRRWRCPEDGCPLFGPERGDDQPLPVYRDGVVRCPEHWQKLSDVGDSPRRVQVKVTVRGTTKHRFQMWPGQETTIGREPEPPGVALRPWLSADAGQFVSRAHAVLRWTGSILTVRDISTNGTRVRDKNKRSGGKPISPGVRHRLYRGDVVVLDDGVELVVSGREFVFDPGPPVEQPTPPAAPAAETRQRAAHVDG